MEPDYLETDELYYELRIRGFPPVVTRHRLATLRDRLTMEHRSEVSGPSGPQNIDPVAEIEICGNKFNELESVFKELVETNSPKIMNSLPSRFIHLLTRLERLNPGNIPSMVNYISDMSKKIRNYLQLIFKAREKEIVLKDHLNKSSFDLLTISSSSRKEKEPVVVVSPPIQPSTAPIPEGACYLPLPSDPKPVSSTIYNSLFREVPIDTTVENLSALLTQIDLGSQLNPTRTTQGAAPEINSLHKTTQNKSRNPNQTNNNYNKNRAGNTPYVPIPNIPRRQHFQPTQNNFVPYNYNPLNYNPPIPNQQFYNYNFDPYQRPPYDYQYQERNANYPQYDNPVYDNQPLGFNNERLYQTRDEDALLQEPPYNRHNRYNILSWKLTFTGEGGISLHDFLIQIPLMARADRISENTLLASAIHLFGGSAREWYIAFQNSFNTWDELTAALREQFLPEDSDYILLKKIESRVQQKNERFVLYLANMLNMFSHLRNEIPEYQKIAIIKRNMLPYLADRLALTTIESLNQLSSLCRKIESIHSSRNITEFEYPAQNISQKPKHRQFNNFELNQTPSFNNVCVSTIRQHPQNGETRCWNCHNEGHDYTNCHLKRLRVFCYKCGEIGQASPTCLKCHPEPKNSNRGTERSGVRLPPRDF